MIKSRLQGRDFRLERIVMTEGVWYVKRFGSGGVVGWGTQARGSWIGSTEGDGVGVDVDVDSRRSAIRYQAFDLKAFGDGLGREV